MSEKKDERRVRTSKGQLVFFVWGFVSLFVGAIYLATQSTSIYGGDAGDLVTAAYTRGIPHPPGFPLYTLLAAVAIKLVPLSTIAWRGALVSSIPAILSRIVLFALSLQLTKSRLLAAVITLVYSVLYPVWLFSIVTEVFSLSILFALVLVYLVFMYIDKKDHRTLYLATLVLGLAFFHNYLIVLVIPGLLYLMYRKKVVSHLKKRAVQLVPLWLAGALPYLYAASVSGSYPLLDHEHPANPVGLLRLASRASFGTFRLAQDVFFNPGAALGGIISFFHFTFADFKIFGVVLIVFGLVRLYKTQKDIFWFFVISLLVVILFFGYASFPLDIRFNQGTFEKYLLLPYFYFVLLLGFGVLFVVDLTTKCVYNKTLQKIARQAVLGAFVVYAAILFANIAPRMFALRADMTAENLALDILESAPQNAILNLEDDTSYYNTLYVRYVLGERPDVTLINFDNLGKDYYQKALNQHFPALLLPNTNQAQHRIVREFLDANAANFPILNSQPHELVRQTWLPHGLLWKYYKEKDTIPKTDDLISSNLLMWERLHLPFQGVLARYEHLLLSDVLRVYARGHQSLGMALFLNKQYDLAKNEFRLAVLYWPDHVPNQVNLARALMKRGECDAAKGALDKALDLDSRDLDVHKYFVDLWANCFDDPKKADAHFRRYRELERQKEEEL